MRFMNISNKLFSFMALAAMVFTAAGCGNGSGAEPPHGGPAVTGVNVFLLAEYVAPWEGAVVIEQGQTEIFYAEVSGRDFPEQDKTWKEVSWSISPDAADGTVIEPVELAVGEGIRLTVPDNAAQGSIFYIRAASVIDGNIYGEAKITVDIPAVTGVIILEELAVVAAGENITFTPVFTGTGNVGSPPLVWEITERVSFTNSADEEEGHLVAAGTGMEGNTLFVDQHEKYGTIRITVTTADTNYSAGVQVLIIKAGTPPLRPPR
ncbi:MAG: hypothetical protein LBB72_04745 [Spirochaetaceae bacterium]|nr:hypothetical protein [Spirochaetaceae bacterium]